MATITAAMVKDLRESTGAGMMDCKQALAENNGDMQTAIDWLRKKGLSKAAKKAGRVAAEGLIGAATSGTKGVVSSYVHNAVIEGAGKMGVIVALESPGKAEELVQLGRQLAMHVAAANPQAIDPAGLDPAVVKREKDVLADKYRQQGKPENVIEKIVESGLKTFYKEVCLLEQAFIHDSGKSVAQAIKEAEGKIGGAVKIAGFVRYALGEGIEKQESDFAAEVAAASGKK